MKELEVRFRLAGLSVDLDALADRVVDMVDDAAVVATHEGVSYVTVSKATDAPLWKAALELATAVEGLGCTIDDIDADLVDLGEVSSRVDRSRETVRLWSLGRRGPGGFPLPVGLLPGSVKIWEWSDVNRWLASAQPELADTVVYMDRDDRAAFRLYGGSVRSRWIRRMQDRSPSKQVFFGSAVAYGAFVVDSWAAAAHDLPQPGARR